MVNRKLAHARSPSLTELTARCSACGLRDLCFPRDLPGEPMRRVEALVSRRVSVPQGAHLYSRNEPFTAVYAVRTGFFKTCTSLENGREHVAGFHMAGELLGLDGVGSHQHTCDAVALEDSKVCVLSFGQLESLAHEFPQLQRHLHRIMGRAITGSQDALRLVTSMRSDVRIAAFLLDLSRRLHARGFSGALLLLRMTREEIGSHLGLTIETVSRTFSKFSELGLLRVDKREIELLDMQGLEAMVRTVSRPDAAAPSAVLRPAAWPRAGAVTASTDRQDF
jgi:CRP/FNR family transcriptional regulator